MLAAGIGGGDGKGGLALWRSLDMAVKIGMEIGGLCAMLRSSVMLFAR